ncbi:ABC-2 type transport system permease protein [Motilibacter peucedani]|uniref:ABC-2 type transport system permease protein n=1 Tax=Motilibacter peucedani TaxID=598650 RepID=A0A420XM63_9ACTN|nr:ABC transporter permease [Motilibacter peucedani]RKS71506.1 ABC-2 type transport system permease protein [Motilibacter peucedani]
MSAGTSIGTDKPQAVIHDVRYSRFEGQLRPRRSAVLALARSSALRALGIRRSAGAKIWPFLLVAAAFAPAVVSVGVPLLLNEVGVKGPLDVLKYSDSVDMLTPILIAYAASTVPSLLTRERRDGVLSLYFSTAVSPGEYVVGKVLAAVAVLSLVTFFPLLLMLVGGIVVADSPVSYARHHGSDWGKVLLVGLVVSLFHAAIGLGLGSLTARRVFAVGGYVALMLVPTVLFGVLFAITSSRGFLALVLAGVPPRLAEVVFGDQTGVDTTQVPPTGACWVVWALVVVAGFGTMVLRYRKGAAT